MPAAERADYGEVVLARRLRDALGCRIESHHRTRFRIGATRTLRDHRLPWAGSRGERT